jgi:hypothetical protein
MGKWATMEISATIGDVWVGSHFYHLLATIYGHLDGEKRFISQIIQTGKTTGVAETGLLQIFRPR